MNFLRTALGSSAVQCPQVHFCFFKACHLLSTWYHDSSGTLTVDRHTQVDIGPAFNTVVRAALGITDKNFDPYGSDTNFLLGMAPAAFGMLCSGTFTVEFRSLCTISPSLPLPDPGSYVSAD